MTIKVGHSEVVWYEGRNDNDPGVKYQGWVCGHSLDGLQVHVDGRILTVKPSEVEEVPKPAIHQLRLDTHSELTQRFGRHAEVHEVEAEVARRREVPR